MESENQDNWFGRSDKEERMSLEIAPIWGLTLQWFKVWFVRGCPTISVPLLRRDWPSIFIIGSDVGIWSRSSGMPVRDYPYSIVSLYLRTGSGEFPLWRRCGRFHYGEPYFWNRCFYCMYTYFVYVLRIVIHYRDSRRGLSDSLSPQGWNPKKLGPGTDRLTDIVIGPSPRVFVCMYGISVWGMTVRYLLYSLPLVYLYYNDSMYSVQSLCNDLLA